MTTIQAPQRVSIDVKDSPVPFTGPMVRAIIANRKHQTRRPMKEQPADHHWAGNGGRLGAELVLTSRGLCARFGWVNRDGHEDPDSVLWVRSPYGQAGDTLWVRETWGTDTLSLYFRADDNMVPVGPKARWKAPMFLKRVDARLFLRILDVRIQRVDEISDDDAVAEGVERYADGSWKIYTPTASFGCDSPRKSFQSLWDGIYGKKPGQAFSDGPWVWAYTFKRI
jgi:hypothetical protein